jgi:hypothetical protein
VLILGHGRHGKDETAKLLKEILNLDFKSSSEAAMMEAVWPVIGHMYTTPKECFDDRANHRDVWKAAISKYNEEDKARLARKILETCDVYVGMRSKEEFKVARPLFDKILWVHRPGFPVEPEMDIEYDERYMHPVVNAGDLDHLKKQLIKIFK